MGVLVCICTFYPVEGSAQGSATGCYLSSTKRVYTFNVAGSGYYPQSFNTPLSPDYCSWTPATGPSCTVCGTGVSVVNGVGSCTGPSPQVLGIGVRNTFTMVPCPIDREIPLIMIAATLLVISRKRMSVGKRDKK